MTAVIVKASEAWPVVAAGLSSAVIVSWITVRVAQKQRAADSERLDQQLAHDRTMREQQRQVDSEGLNRQLAHDQDMRDLQYLRETLKPIVSRGARLGRVHLAP
jgi:anti-sigma factor RsiW